MTGEKKHYIYGLVDPRTGDTKYIGYTANPHQRGANHCSITGGNPGKDAWTKELRAEGYRPVMQILETVESKEAAQTAEVQWINKLQREGATLFNAVYRGCEKPLPYWRRLRGW